MISIDPRRRAGWLVAFLTAILSLTWQGIACAADQPPIDPQIERLIRQLNADDVVERDRAEQALLELAPSDGAATEDFFQQLPKITDRMPAEVRLRLTRIRQTITTRIANRTVHPTKVTITGEDIPLADVLTQLDKQTGNHLVDYRDKFGQEAEARSMSIDITDQEFWPAIDAILDDAGLDLYPFSGEETLAVVQREPQVQSRQEAVRSGKAEYAGPFRIEAVEVTAQRGLRQPGLDGLKVKLEIAWEPRLRPISISLAGDALSVVDVDGTPIARANTQASLDVEVQSGNHATELVIPLKLPGRHVEKLARFSGQFVALVPGKIAEFRFDHLGDDRGGAVAIDRAKANRTAQQQGGVTVSLDQVRQNHELWEVYMRLRLDGPTTALESHRGWVFQNLTYLLNKQGEIIDHAGFETVLQTEEEVGLAYFFELPDENPQTAINNYTWVYRTPAAIIQVPVEFELRDIPLP